MNISDLNYLETTTEEVVGGRRRRRRGNRYDVNGSIRIKKDVDIHVNVFETYDKAIFGAVNVYGNLATAEAAADASGYDTFAETITFTDAIAGHSSEAYSASVSGAI